MSNWQDAYQGLDLIGGRITFLSEDYEEMIEIRYDDGMVIDVGYLDHWRSYFITVLSDDTKEAWQNPIEDITVDNKAALATEIQRMINKHRGKYTKG